MEKKYSVCPLALAGILDNKIRNFLHNPTKILKPYINKNMTIMDIGCGPGVFSIEAAKLLEGTGKVISVDMQEGMLEILRNKIKGQLIEKNIVLHKCTQYCINVTENVDLVLMIYMVHEVPNKENMFNEILPLINKNGLLIIIEHKFVSKKQFNKIINIVKEKGFIEDKKLKIALSRGIVLKKL
jgi:ubiquinone/menaquinone biosynthesis C-methylase UbiE